MLSLEKASSLLAFLFVDQSFTCTFQGTDIFLQKAYVVVFSRKTLRTKPSCGRLAVPSNVGVVVNLYGH